MKTRDRARSKSKSKSKSKSHRKGKEEPARKRSRSRESTRTQASGRERYRSRSRSQSSEHTREEPSLSDRLRKAREDADTCAVEATITTSAALRKRLNVTSIDGAVKDAQNFLPVEAVAVDAGQQEREAWIAFTNTDARCATCHVAYKERSALELRNCVVHPGQVRGGQYTCCAMVSPMSFHDYVYYHENKINIKGCKKISHATSAQVKSDLHYITEGGYRYGYCRINVPASAIDLVQKSSVETASELLGTASHGNGHALLKLVSVTRA